MKTVKMRGSYKSNHAGDICGYPADEAEELVAQGKAYYYDTSTQSVQKSDPAARQKLKEMAKEQQAEDLEDLPWPKLKKRAYEKAAEQGDDLEDLLPDQSTPSLLSYLQE